MLAAAPWLASPGSGSHTSAADTSVNDTGKGKISMPWSFSQISGMKGEKGPQETAKFQIVMSAMQRNKQRAEIENVRGGALPILEVIREVPFEQVTFKLRLQE